MVTKSIPRNTRQKRAVRRALDEARRPLSPGEVHSAVIRQISSISLATVYRIIRSLLEDGELVSVPLPGAPDRYETRICADHHHHHFHCDGCERVYDIPGCGLKVDTTLPTDFSMTRHEVVLYGLCASCSTDNSREGR